MGRPARRAVPTHKGAAAPPLPPPRSRAKTTLTWHLCGQHGTCARCHALVPASRLPSQTAQQANPPNTQTPQVVSIKSKYILLNDTGLGIEFKQRGTPDPGDARYAAYGECRRFAGPLQPSER